MKFSSFLSTAAVFALANAAQFTMPPQAFVGITVGTPVNITWSGASGPVTLLLKNGDPTALQTVATISSGLTGTTFSWTPSASLANGEYALEIDDSTGPNYSVQFALTGGSSSISSSALSTATLTSTTVGNTTTTASSSSATHNSTASTTTSKSGSTSTKSSSSSTSTSTSTTPNTNSASSFASPLALVFLAFAAMMTLN